MKNIRKSLIIILLAIAGWVQAQEVTTMYFLENAPMRHIVNPAFQPVSNGYINFTPLGYSSFWIGNNSMTPSDFIYNDKASGRVITFLHPNADRTGFYKSRPKNMLINNELSTNMLSFGARVKDNGYFHIGLMMRMDVGMSYHKELSQFLLGGGMTNLTGVNNVNFTNIGLTTKAYFELAGGYSHRINDQWTVGGKLKLLLGVAYVNLNTRNTQIDASVDEWKIQGQPRIEAAGPLNFNALPEKLSLNELMNMQMGDLVPGLSNWKTLLKPSGYGAAIDLGFTYKPHPQVQITAAINDLGFIYWTNARSYNATIDTIYNGVGEFQLQDYYRNGTFYSDSLMNDALSNLKGLAQGVHMADAQHRFARMVNAKLNVGIDANFWENRIGIGVLSSTKLYNSKIYEEVTFGAALRPCNWFNLAVSYSLLQNGKYSNIGAGFSFMPYDGINLTLAMDYIPTHYAHVKMDGTSMGNIDVTVPNHIKGLNLAIGFSIVWGTNHKKDRDKDGVQDKIDMCPNTPKNVKVDNLGCPLDSDGDGVPDYLDQCPGTPSEAYGLIDENGCPVDSDGDGVPDYLDECPNTPEAAYGLIDEKGCPLDSDHDGVPDYLDECPETPEEAIGYTDEKGCLLDTDGDGVPDFIDKCPNTPVEAIGFVDANGCERDTDGDGVPDWRDRCPNTPKEAIGHVDEYGCEIDTDGDGLPDYKDECPTIAGPAYNKGCPEVKREIRNLLNKAMQGIQFETGKAVILKKSYPLLDEIAQTFIDNPTYIIEVQGHTDNVGKADLNKKLSEQRAHAVMDYLVKAGVSAERMTAHGYGAEVPIADNKTAAGRAKNRRVEFNITFEEVTYETVLEHVDSTLYKQHLDSIQPKALPTDSADSAVPQE